MRDGSLHYLERIVEAYDKAATAAVESYQGAETRSEGSENQYMARGQYWRPQLKQAEWDLLEWRMNAEIKSGENFLDEATKWVYADEKGVQVFALYGIGDGTEATPLYAVGGKRAKQIADDLRMMEDAYEKTDGGRGAVDSWIESIRRAKGSRNGNRSTDGNGRTAVQNDGLHGGSSGSDGRRASGRGTENQRGVKDQFSLREPVGSYQGVETRSDGKAQKEQLAIREAFADEIDQWAKDGKPEGVRFTLGSTGPVLQGLGAIESDIYMEGDKISTILQDHPEMTLAEIKKIPQILEDPALVLKSKTRGGTSNTRLVLLDTAKAKNGRNIVAVLDLRPVEKGFAIDDIQKVSSAYTKTATENRTAKENSRDFLKTSDVLFLDKKRATSLLKTMGFSMPIELHRNGYVGSISYFKQNVNIKGLPFSSVVQEGDVQFSLRDSEGRSLTEAQQDYFKDSKVRGAPAAGVRGRRTGAGPHQCRTARTTGSMTYIQDKNNTVWEATLNVAESANGVKYLYDINPIEKVGPPVKSSSSTTFVGPPVKSGTSTTVDIVAQDQTESQAQIRSSTLSDRDVLRIAAQMAKNSESRSLTDADRSAPLNFGYHEAKHLIQSCFIQIEAVSVLQCVLPCFLFRISIFNHQRHRTGKYTNSEQRSICGNEKFFPAKINRAVFCREGSFHSD